MILCFDTETTGIPSTKVPWSHPQQPHLVAASCLQVDPSNNFVHQSMSKLVIPETWEWNDSAESPDQAFKVHCITMERATNFGRSEREVLDEILHLWDNNAELVAHNLDFDRRVVACAIARYYPDAPALLDAWLAAPGTCTMRSNKELIGARTASGRAKFPNLAEAYHFFFKEDFDNRHSANADAVAVFQIYAAMQALS